jgi:hypothetical protein
VGTKILLYPNITASSTDYAIGIASGTLWYSVNTTGSAHRFYAGTTEIFTILGTGNLGVGTTAPSGKLEIKSDPSAAMQIRIRDAALNKKWDIAADGGYGDATNDDLFFATNSGYNAVVFTNGGYVGIGVNNPSHILQINGVGRSTSATWATSSDIRVKENVRSIENGLEKIVQLNPVSFQYTSEYTGQNSGYKGTYLGFLAQEVKNILPELVTETSEKIGDKTINDFLLLNQGELIPIMVDAIKQQNQLIEGQNKLLESTIKENQQLKSQLQSLQEKVDQIEAVLAKAGVK